MIIVATFVANAGLNFVLGLLVAWALGPAAFGLYAVAASLAVVLNSGVFDWLRLSAARFYTTATREADPSLRATLELGYAALAVATVVALALVLALGWDVGLPGPLLAAAAAAGICMSLFDYQASLARARFLQGTYARLVLAKNGAAFLLMVAAAVLTRDPLLVLLASAAASAAALLLARRPLADPAARLALARPGPALAFAAYGLPLVAANVAYQLVPLANRSVLAAENGFAEAGQYALAADIGVRLFMALGSALDILLFQLAVRAEEREGREAGERQVGRNLVGVLALLLPFAILFWILLPELARLAVPGAFRAAFVGHTTVLIPALLAFAVILYGLNPVFQLRRRTGPVIAAAVVALLVDLLLILLLPGRLGPVGYAAAQLGAYGAALLTLGALAWRGGGLRLPARDLGLVLAAAGLLVAGLLPLRLAGAEPGLLWPAALLAGAAYAALLLASDVAGVRGLLAARLRPASRAAPAV